RAYPAPGAGGHDECQWGRAAPVGAGGLLRAPRADRRRRRAGLEGARERRTANLRGPSTGYARYPDHDCRARRGEATTGRSLGGLCPDVPAVAGHAPPALGTPARVRGPGASALTDWLRSGGRPSGQPTGPWMAPSLRSDETRPIRPFPSPLAKR